LTELPLKVLWSRLSVMVSYFGNPEIVTDTLSPTCGTLTPMPSDTLPPGLTDSEWSATVRAGATGWVVPPLVVPLLLPVVVPVPPPVVMPVPLPIVVPVPLPVVVPVPLPVVVPVPLPVVVPVPLPVVVPVPLPV